MKIEVITPYKKTIELEIIEKENSLWKILKDIKPERIIYRFPSERYVYKLKDGKYLIKYTRNSFGLLVQNEIELEDIFSYGGDYGLLSLWFKKGRENYHYSFEIHSNFTKKLLKSFPQKELDGYEHILYFPPIIKPNQSYKTIQFQDGSVLFYTKRTESIYDGTWFNDFASFEYYFKSFVEK